MDAHPVNITFYTKTTPPETGLHAAFPIDDVVACVHAVCSDLNM